MGKAPFAASGKAVGTGHTEGFVKIVSDAKYGEILGAQIIGYGATELINEIALGDDRRVDDDGGRRDLARASDARARC